MTYVLSNLILSFVGMDFVIFSEPLIIDRIKWEMTAMVWAY
jgi:hypothetical protein